MLSELETLQADTYLTDVNKDIKKDKILDIYI